MRKILGMVAIAMAILLISGVAVFAATIDTATAPTGTVIGDADMTITATALTSVSQITVIVYNGATPDASNIAYIDQAANTTGTVTFTFKMRDAFVGGSYTVKIGGTDVATPKETSFAYSLPLSGGTVSGVVTAFGDPAIAVSVTIKDAGGLPVATPSVDAATGAFTADVAAGTYSVELSKNYHVPRVISAVGVQAGATTDVGTTALIAGDLNNDGFIEESDFSILSNAWYAGVGDPTFDVAADINGDGFVEESDFSILSNSWYKGADNYNQ